MSTAGLGSAQLKSILTPALSAAAFEKGSCLYVIERGGNRLVLAGVVGVRNPTRGTFPEHVDVENPGAEFPVLAEAANDRRSIYIQDTMEDPGWTADTDRIKSAYLVPVLGRGRTLAVFGLFSDRADGFDDAQREMADAMGMVLARMIEQEVVWVKRVKHMEQSLHKVARALEEAGVGLQKAPEVQDEAAEQFRDLSPREWEVIRELASNRRVPGIAKTLHISQHTVRNHLKSIFRKLEVHSQSELLEMWNRLHGV